MTGQVSSGGDEPAATSLHAATGSRSPDGREASTLDTLATDARRMGGAISRDLQAISRFADPSQEWRRLICEFIGTFLLVVVGAGGGRRQCLYRWTDPTCRGGDRAGAHGGRDHTASGAHNVGPMSAIAVGGYITLAGLWSSPISGASMNPARLFGPDLALWDFSNYQVYLIGPLVGAAVAVGIAWLLSGAGGDESAIRAAQGTLRDPVTPTG